MNRIDRLEQQARNATSLTDFGEESYRQGLGILVSAIDGEAQLNEIGQAAMDMQIVDLLTCRLQIEDWYRRHPEINDEEIVAPLIGLGLPRTGSTALSCLLAEDPAVRSIRTWESLWPCPPPETATYHTDARIAKAQESMDRRNQLFPRMKTMLPSTATSPTECQTFMGMDFKSQLFQAFAKIPSYVDWLNHQADLVPTYTYVKRILKLLQWRCPPTNWRLKNPSHSMFITDLDKVFPDARYWMTHRDISKVLPSVADLYFELHKAFSNHVDKHWLGEVNLEFCTLGMQRMINFRNAGNDDRFFDIHFAPFQKDPFPKLRELYDFLGEELSDNAITRMHAWRNNTPRDKHGDHTYNAADYGLDLPSLHHTFRFYNEHFQLQQYT